VNLKLHNTASRRKETFRPMKEGKVGMYVCGVTVYDLCHIGHARSAIVFDVLARYLRSRGLDVTYVRNFTDIDDKIIQRARETGKNFGALAQENIDAFYEDMGRLGVLKADVEPRATEHIDGMISMISSLIEKGYAYVVDHDVFFSVQKFQGYGELSGRKLEDMQAGSRIDVDEKKNHPMDFILWKGAKPDEPQWPSPWGQGRPGWHIECSVMSNHYLGPTFDIHGGGLDLLFPHHENERAQSIGANGGKFARYWVHNGFVTVESEKMSKSLGNFLTIRNALKYYHPEVLRVFLLSKHYRSPLDFSKSSVLALQSGLIRIYRTLERIESAIGSYEDETIEVSAPYRQLNNAAAESGFLEEFIKMMDDDLNTAGAMGLIFDKVREINRLLDSGQEAFDKLAKERLELFLAGNVLGLFQEEPQKFFKELSGSEPAVDPLEIERMIEERSAAREMKDWSKADDVRDRLKEMGILLEDGPHGTTWRLDV